MCFLILCLHGTFRCHHSTVSPLRKWTCLPRTTTTTHHNLLELGIAVRINREMTLRDCVLTMSIPKAGNGKTLAFLVHDINFICLTDV